MKARIWSCWDACQQRQLRKKSLQCAGGRHSGRTHSILLDLHRVQGKQVHTQVTVWLKHYYWYGVWSFLARCSDAWSQALQPVLETLQVLWACRWADGRLSLRQPGGLGCASHCFQHTCVAAETHRVACGTHDQTGRCSYSGKGRSLSGWPIGRSRHGYIVADTLSLTVRDTVGLLTAIDSLPASRSTQNND
jgi:hypothetical protein